jgi:[CysO sulfur-carrier protein]-thiocarboxylate-dependent cysteine synthase
MDAVIASSLLDLVGNTPLVELPRLSPKPGVQLYAKLEGQNPTGSIKDRVAKAMLDDIELEDGQVLLEPTSGNTGISLALIAKLKGYPLTCVMPANATAERRQLLELYGATIVESPADQGSNGAVRVALEMAKADSRYVMPFQYENPANPRAHYEGTGAEIVEALDRVDVLVAGLGTGGTLMGAGARLREAFPDVVVAAAEPLPGDPVMGLRSLEDGYVPPILDVSKLDRKVLVSNEEAVRAVRALLDLEGVFGGVSAGAVVHVARKLAEELDGGVVVCVLADAGWKYLSADFWNANDVGKSMESTLWWCLPPPRFGWPLPQTPTTRIRTKRAVSLSCATVSPNGTSGVATQPRRRTASSSSSRRSSGFSRTTATSSPCSTLICRRRRARRAPTSRTSGSGKASRT